MGHPIEVLLFRIEREADRFGRVEQFSYLCGVFRAVQGGFFLRKKPLE
jgi:hypothetical protein